jgi:hypothetical protein
VSRIKRRILNAIIARKYGLARPLQILRPLPIVVVVCDDTKTAVAYFNVLKQLVKTQVTVRVVPKPSDRGSAQDVLNAAKYELDSLESDGSHDSGDKNSVWALIDLEGDKPRQAAARTAQKRGRDVGVKVVLSLPCYELWTLLHLVDTGETFLNCNAVIVRLVKEWKRMFRQEFGKKAQADYGKIINKRFDASTRAKIHRKRNDPSWTEVYMVIDHIHALC